MFAIRTLFGKADLLHKLDKKKLATKEGRRENYAVATSVTGAAIQVVKTAEEGDGAAAYKALVDHYDPKRVSKNIGLLRELATTKCPDVS